MSLEVVDTTHSSLQISTRVNFTNPTDYSATVPYADALVIFNDTAVAHVVVRNFSVVPGNNTNATVEFSWNPLKTGGKDGVDAGRKLISSFISGKLGSSIANSLTGYSNNSQSRVQHDYYTSNP